MKIATLAILVQGDWVLLGRKKTGEIGAETFNGPGGKCEEGESLIDCVIRETKEELGIRLDRERLEKVAIITFYFAYVPAFETHVFRTNFWRGTPINTKDMSPIWYRADALPLPQMLESDREWFSKAVNGGKFRANVYYKEKAANFEKIEFFPFDSKI